MGFDRLAFTEEQQHLLEPFVGVEDLSYFMATYYMYFPFLTCEMDAVIHFAERRNAHSMTLAVRAIVELFRLVKREREVDREILAFSISHDDSKVIIYGHYPVIDGTRTKYYCHQIQSCFISSSHGEEKWTAYKFTKNVYDHWMPGHFKRICSAIDDISPSVDS